MVYSSKESRTHRFCVPNMAEWDSSKELRCGVSETERSRRIYRALPENKKSIQEARRIFALYQKDKKRCDAGEFAGYLYCTLGCESDRTKLLVKVEYTECIDESHNR